MRKKGSKSKTTWWIKNIFVHIFNRVRPSLFIYMMGGSKQILPIGWNIGTQTYICIYATMYLFGHHRRIMLRGINVLSAHYVYWILLRANCHETFFFVLIKLLILLLLYVYSSSRSHTYSLNYIHNCIRMPSCMHNTVRYISNKKKIHARNFYIYAVDTRQPQTPLWPTTR